MAMILLVDDEHEILELLKLIIEEFGHQALTAHNGTVGLALARQHKPNLVLTDLMMPFMDGYALVAAIQADLVLQTIPVVVMTSGMITDKDRTALGPIQAVIAKPFFVEQIQALCDSIEKGGLV